MKSKKVGVCPNEAIIMELDQVDKTILTQLRCNCKLTHKQLSEKTGLNINTIASRIKRLEKNQYIFGYETHIDYLRIGYRYASIIRLNLKSLKNMNHNDLSDIISIPEVVLIVGSTGPFDLNMLVRSKNVDSLLDIIAKIGKNKFVLSMDTEFVVKEYKTYEEFNPFIDFNQKKTNELTRRKPIDELDLFILREIRKRANIPLRELSDIVKSPISTIKERIDRLEDSGIIKGYFADLNFPKLGYWGFGAVRIKLKADYINDQTIVEKLFSFKELATLYRSMGDYELIAGFLVTGPDQSLDIIKEISNIPGVLKTETEVAISILKTNMQFNPLKKQ